MNSFRRMLFALLFLATSGVLHAEKIGENPAATSSAINSSLIEKLQFPNAEIQRIAGGLAVVQFTVDSTGTVQVLGVAANNERLAQFVEQRLHGAVLTDGLQPGMTYLVKLSFKAV